MPDTFPTPRVWTAGERVSAAKMNEISTALAVLFPYAAGGDIAYRDPAGAYLTALSKPAGLGLLQNSAAGIPSYLTGGSALQVLRKNAANNGYEWAGVAGLHAKATADYNASEQNISATSYQDITNATVNIVTTKTCTIVMHAYGVMAVNFAGNRAFVQAVIGGTGSGDTGAPHTSSPYYVPFAINYYRTGISAGTVTCKLQGKANAGGNVGIFERGRIIVMAFEE